MTIQAYNMNTAYPALIQEVLFQGHKVQPRGRPTLEALGVTLHLSNPTRNILVSPVRALNYPFMVAEWLWILQGHNAADLIVPYNKNIEQYSRDGFFEGAYGPPFVEQLPYVLRTIQDDLYTRQAVLSIWRPRPMPSFDIPCTLTMHFMARDRTLGTGPNGYTGPALDLHVTMRSNDLWLGLPYDVFTFTQLQRYVAMLLGLQVGHYYHHVNSLHLYEKDLEKAHKVVEEHAQIRWDAQGALDPVSPPLTRMPVDFKAMYYGITHMSRHAEAKADLMRWLGSGGSWITQPWYDYLLLLAYRFHKDESLLPKQWAKLMELRHAS